ncbi:MAG TPA: SAM-dependent methyltransferase [Acidimicrobiales bacterium]
MRTGHASRTAEHNALFRALESSRRPSQRFFEDSLARAFLTGSLAWAGRLGAVPGVRALVTWFIDRRWPGPRTAVVARTVLIDDAIAAAVDGQIAQCVILGAGYDTRAHRLACLQDVTVFEVDHPDTQQAKQRVLPVRPSNVRYVASDFNHQTLDAAMAEAGYEATVPTVFLWEGVTNYLTADAVDATLRWCAQAAAGSVLVFTYVHRDVLTNPGAFTGGERLFATLAKVGETFTFGFDPQQLPDYLAERGLVLEQDVGAAEFRARYYRAAAAKMHGHEFYRVATARVAGPG